MAFFSRCKYCLSWLDKPTSFCPFCGKDIDRQLARMSSEEVNKLFGIVEFNPLDHEQTK